MKKLLITIIAIGTLVIPNFGFTQINNHQLVTPAYIKDGNVMPIVTLPEVTIHATNNKEEVSGYSLPEVTITAERNVNHVYPAVMHDTEYIALVNLKPVDIIAKQKKITLASLFSFLWLFSKY
ncbi:MAG: hypothetical protein JSS90_04025 [Bacteroidetes bacterium]|jgi:hypothetical protein|nr:hypothetical protein [Bacteroidota bacterium]